VATAAADCLKKAFGGNADSAETADLAFGARQTTPKDLIGNGYNLVGPFDNIARIAKGLKVEPCNEKMAFPAHSTSPPPSLAGLPGQILASGGRRRVAC